MEGEYISGEVQDFNLKGVPLFLYESAIWIKAISYNVNWPLAQFLNKIFEYSLLYVKYDIVFRIWTAILGNKSMAICL